MIVPALMVVAVIAVLAGIAVVSTGYGGELAVVGSSSPRRSGLDLPTGRRLTPADLEELGFSPGLWGYPPEQVEELLDRAAGALAERDAHIVELERRLSDLRAPGALPADRGDDGEPR